MRSLTSRAVSRSTVAVGNDSGPTRTSHERGAIPDTGCSKSRLTWGAPPWTRCKAA